MHDLPQEQTFCSGFSKANSGCPQNHVLLRRSNDALWTPFSTKEILLTNGVARRNDVVGATIRTSLRSFTQQFRNSYASFFLQRTSFFAWFVGVQSTSLERLRTKKHPSFYPWIECDFNFVTSKIRSNNWRLCSHSEGHRTFASKTKHFWPSVKKTSCILKSCARTFKPKILQQSISDRFHNSPLGASALVELRQDSCCLFGVLWLHPKEFFSQHHMGSRNSAPALANAKTW